MAVHNENAIGERMIAVGVREPHGTVEVLDLPAPREPMSGELLLRVVAAGIGPWDALLHTGGWDVGLQLPGALGVEAVGQVLAVGPDVDGFQAGDTVLVHDAPLPGGSGMWAEQVLVRASSSAHCPPGLAPEIAAGLPVAALTARQALDDLQVASGTRLLVVGSGPTAALAVRLAALAGTHVVAAAGRAHVDRLLSLGATDVIDSRSEGWNRTTDYRFDAVLVAAGGTAWDAITLLDDGGRLCSITSDAPEPERGIVSTDLYVRPDGDELARLATLAAAGDLTVETRVVTVAEGPATADVVASGRSGGTKYVIQFARV
jgi:NADPH:quinone reductase-like Zn-dependent oxidoreductase